MKNIFLFALLLSVLTGCGSRGGKTTAGSILDSLELRSELGEVVERHFTGTIPSADGPGIRYQLVLYNQQHSGDGVYELTRTYLEAENGKDKSFNTSGRWLTLRGDATDIDATVIQLLHIDKTGHENFLYRTDSLILLNRDFELPDSAMLPLYVLHKSGQ